jgi:exodeoxyribonuclease V alpha subunit
LYIGSEYNISATLQYNTKYKSYQYVPSIVTAITPKTVDEQSKFLETIITQRQAEILLSEYPNVVQDTIDNTIEMDTSKLKGIGDTTWDMIKEKIINNYVISDILVLLQPLGVTFNMIKKLLSYQSNPSLLKDELLENPYIMTKINGLGFKKVDDLALKLNSDLKVSERRTIAFIKYYFKTTGDNEGHTWVELNTLENAVRDNIYECMDVFNKLIEKEKGSQNFLFFFSNIVGLKKYYNIEIAIYNILDYLDSLQSNYNINIEEINNGIKEAEIIQGYTLTDEQSNIIKDSINKNITIIAGKAGSGKSSILRSMLKIYKNKNLSIACVALSAKAAQRITEATGHKATTIHRLLGVDREGFI